MIDQVAYLGARVSDALEAFGEFARFCLATAYWTLRGRGTPRRWRLLIPQFYEIGTKSIPVVGIVGGFVGMVLAIEMFGQFQAYGLEDRLGGIINVSVVRQIGPVLAAVMIAGRVGGAVSAELGTMRVTEQIDAMRAMGTDPIAYLVSPRVLACLFMVPLLTVFSNLLGIFGGYLVTVGGFGVNPTEYWAFSRQFVERYDVMSGLVKSVFFGLSIGLISCYKGFNCKPGAEGVGRAATDSFVTSFVAIIVLNFFLAKFLKDLYDLLYSSAMAGGVM